jgi:CubicO group peptidase (beta-lactamase class C family)
LKYRAVILAFILFVSVSLSAFAQETADWTGQPEPAGQGETAGPSGSVEQAGAAGLAELRQPLTPETASAFLDSFFSIPQIEALYTGASVVIVKDDQIIAQKGYGYADAERETPVDPASTLFRIASVSKTFTAAAILQLAEEGLIDLQEDIRTYLDIDFDNPFDTPVTVEHLLTHMSGFEVRDPKQDDLHDDFDLFVSIEDYVHANMPPVVRKPGTAYMYDNFAYLLLGLIVQNVSGEPYESYMAKRFFEPLGMDHSGFVLDGERLRLESLATGYGMDGSKVDHYVFKPTIMPHGGMYSTAEDIGRFMIALLNGGQYGSERILDQSSVESMFVYRSVPHPLLPDTTYGFEAAFQIPGVGASEAIVTKAGDLPGYGSYLVLLPEEKVGFFLTHTKQSILRIAFFQQFLAAFFPDYAVPPQWNASEPAGADELQRYSGLYTDLRLKTLLSVVSVGEGGTLTISDAFLGSRPLTQVDERLFRDELSQTFTVFVLDGENGEVFMKEGNLNPLGYAQKAPEPFGFTDVDPDSPFATYIHSLQSIGLYPNEAGLEFRPGETISRGELVRILMESSGISEAGEPGEPAFADIAGHPDAGYIQLAYDLGMVKGNGQGQFAPDRPATRQEAAVMVWNVWRLKYPEDLFGNVPLSGETAEWAVPAVRMMVALGLHGPDVTYKPDMTVDYRSTDPMTRQEAAALIYQLLTQPVDMIVAQMYAGQPAESPAEPPAESPAETPAETPAEHSANEPADQPAHPSAEQPVEQPVKQ